MESTAPRSVRIVTFGCKANQYDSQVLREALSRRGWRESEEGGELVVMNTCTVTEDAGRKAKKLIRRLHRENPAARIVVVGCLAENEAEHLRDLEGVSDVLTGGEAKRPAHFLAQIGETVSPEELGIPSGITEFAGHTRAFLKIQDGCDRSCAFCIIPRVRGRSRSRPAAELEAELERLVRSGHREVVLCGIHIGHWGLDLGHDLAHLLERLARLEVRDELGQELPFRLRLSSIEATEVLGGVLEVLAEHPGRIAPHLHMPLQSGDDGVLRAMNRWYTAGEYLEACDRIRAALDRPAFSADVLVGFPGEDEAAFENTARTVREAGFARVHVFPFSPRPGTAAANASALRPDLLRERRARLGELAREEARTYRRSLVGTLETVVLEGSAGLCGRYQRVRIPLERLPDLPPPLLDVRLELGEVDEPENPLVGIPVEGSHP